ncbi:MAG: hypothetical protein NTX63_04600 [Candidatus Peregrinibacteria bacterium]|nr:hypothetical protein [Candidatus Peregrinibacteria bacterium]
MASPESNNGKSDRGANTRWIARQNADIDAILYPEAVVRVVRDTRRDVGGARNSQRSDDYNPHDPRDRSNSLDDY